MLTRIAKGLRPLKDKVVFVGGRAQFRSTAPTPAPAPCARLKMLIA